MTGFMVLSILLTLRFPGVAGARSPQECDENFPMIRVALNSNVSVRCPNMTAKEMTFRLSMGKAKVDSSRILIENSTGERVIHVQDSLALWVNEQDHTVSFHISRVQKEQTGLYTCEAWISFPPPGGKVQDAPKTLLLVEEYPCEKVVASERTSVSVPIPQEACSQKWWILAVLLAIAITFGVVVTITSFVIWLKLKRVELSHNYYMNTKARGPVGQRKGVQLPLPRWF
ncbi:T-cell-specific surface glycoprotein CD28 isoform X2 [Hypomesus transpacificus]|uniref:T-cell-specific surface glycoprotein CD28 isoform X2 n=1 Tax=Hypomesus transpacificus TaxID=137520 RepID=UPI001F078A0B|nr:T-cell-specific surface glycoprotein CD28 isoform X2 [Hypomesus transpacificus]